MEEIKLNEEIISGENCVFKIAVKKTNYFEIKFGYDSNINSKSYYYFIENIKLSPLGDYKYLLIGSNITENQYYKSFGISNIGELLNYRQPRFDIELIINVPFFKKGHYLHIRNICKYNPNENSKASIHFYDGFGNNKEIIKDLELISNELTSFQVNW
ncbi:hypothetical protein ACFOWU_09550 [Epilithonimonas zeae]|uniref:Uncharacterized protein n=1 Tax=Epilithonimonas zeae TaxID=1416779 RepID=A0A1N6GQW5_9FLAO|nr:hypothetical protein [Epilithonimonas zeae]SIO09877.1 hypothetical protein SAMN05444409_1993 [Epilithonimonas zeae]